MLSFDIDIGNTEGMREGMGLSINDVDEVFVILEVLDESTVKVCSLEEYAFIMPSTEIH